MSRRSGAKTIGRWHKEQSAVTSGKRLSGYAKALHRCRTEQAAKTAASFDCSIAHAPFASRAQKRGRVADVGCRSGLLTSSPHHSAPGKVSLKAVWPIFGKITQSCAQRFKPGSSATVARPDPARAALRAKGKSGNEALVGETDRVGLDRGLSRLQPLGRRCDVQKERMCHDERPAKARPWPAGARPMAAAA